MDDDSTTINAYYDPQLNTINFPAGILQPPYFDPQMDDSVNYGAIGMVIGHEIIHGFDDQGRKFDAHGNLRDWWTAEDAKKYDERGKCISGEYTQDVPMPARTSSRMAAHSGRRYRRQRRHSACNERA